MLENRSLGSESSLRLGLVSGWGSSDLAFVHCLSDVSVSKGLLHLVGVSSGQAGASTLQDHEL